MIVLISESLLLRSTTTDGRILRDRVLSGFGVRLNARKRTFLVAASVRGKQFRMMLGYWPLMSVEKARSKAKGIKASCQRRYESFFRTHFGTWLDQTVDTLGHGAFGEHCHDFAQNTGKSLVEQGRSVIGAVIMYINAVYGLEIQSSFVRLDAAGLLPERTQPRAQVLQESGLPRWREAIDKLGGHTTKTQKLENWRLVLRASWRTGLVLISGVAQIKVSSNTAISGLNTEA